MQEVADKTMEQIQSKLHESISKGSMNCFSRISAQLNGENDTDTQAMNTDPSIDEIEQSKRDQEVSNTSRTKRSTSKVSARKKSSSSFKKTSFSFKTLAKKKVSYVKQSKIVGQKKKGPKLMKV